ncbi:MAG TPA: glycerate kinase [Pseudonocardia sp.]
MTDVVLAPDKFKGSLTAPRVAAHLATGMRAADPHLRVVSVPVADGGDGFMAAAVGAGYRMVRVPASGPTGEPLTGGYAERDGTAVIELADTAGLARLPGGRPAPLRATSAGTGQVIRAVLDAGCRTLLLGLGGSACTDGGAGMLTALGARLLGATGPGGAGLLSAHTLDLRGLHPGLMSATVVVAGDVANPLLGPTGAAQVYGQQKGASLAEVAVLERGLSRWAELVYAATGRELAGQPGAGAAGGVGFGAMAVLGASARRGIDVVLEMTGLARRLAGARLVVTGEGSLDEQTGYGKAPAGVAALAAAEGIPVVAVAGRCTLSEGQLRAIGITAGYSLLDLQPDRQRCMAEAGPLLQRVGADLARRWLGR